VIHDDTAVVIPHRHGRRNRMALEALRSVYGQAKIIVAMDHYGRGPAHAIARAEIEYYPFPPLVFVLDDDDVAMPGAIEKMRQALVDSKAPFVYANFQAEKDDVVVPYPSVKNPTLNSMRTFFGLRGLRGYKWDMVQQVGGLDTTLPQFEDVDIALRLAAKFGDPAYVDEILTQYRIHPGQMTKHGQPDPDLLRWIKARPL
jgi:hypothetical protein